MESKIMGDEHQEAEKSPTRRLQSRAPPSLALNSKTNRTFALENGTCSHVPIPLLSPLSAIDTKATIPLLENGTCSHVPIPLLSPLSAIDTKATIPLLTPLAVDPEPLPCVEESYRVSTARETQLGTEWQHPALQLQPRCSIVHKDAPSFYDPL